MIVPIRRDDEGSIVPLVAGLGALCLALVLVVVSATSLYLERKRLFTFADTTALAAAEAFDLDAAITGPTLTTEGGGDLVDRQLAAAPEHRGDHEHGGQHQNGMSSSLAPWWTAFEPCCGAKSSNVCCVVMSDRGCAVPAPHSPSTCRR